MQGEIRERLGKPEDLSFAEPTPINGRHRLGFRLNSPQGEWLEGYATYPRTCEGVVEIYPHGLSDDRLRFFIE